MDLDLGVFKKDTLNITLLDGRVVRVNKPSKKLLIELNEADIELAKTIDFKEIVNKLEEITAKILSNNTGKKPFTVEMIQELEIDYSLQTAIFKSYMEFITKLSKN